MYVRHSKHLSGHMYVHQQIYIHFPPLKKKPYAPEPPQGPSGYKAPRKKAQAYSLGFCFGTPSGARTLDTLIKSQVLYQLS